MSQIDKQTIQRLARSAAESYISSKTGSLNEAVADAVRSEGYNPDQIERVAQATNQATWAMLTAVKDPASVRFDPADGNRVMTMIEPANPVEEVKKEASASFWSQKITVDFASEIGFQTPIEKDAALVIPTPDSRTWDDISRTLRKAQLKIGQEYDTACLMTEKLAWELIDRVHDGYQNDSLSSESIRKAVTDLVPNQASALLGDLDSAVFSTEKAAAYFSDMEREANLNRLTALPLYRNTRMEVPQEHPIRKTAQELAATYQKRDELKAAIEYLRDLQKQATQLAEKNAEVPAHVSC